MIVALAAVAILAGALPAAAQARISYAGYTWNVFDGTGRLGQHWSASHLTVKNGILTELISGSTAAGAGMQHWQTYGTYQVRFRISRGEGKYAILLFGKGPHQEIDFGESHPTDSQRTEMTGTVHWGTSNQMIHLSVKGDFTQWHTTGLVWKPGSLTFTLDGKVWAHVTEHVPSSAMHMTIQTNATGSGGPAKLEVSNVSIH